MITAENRLGFIGEELGFLKEKDLYRRLRILSESSATSADIDGKKVILFASNDYLGLSKDERVKKAFTDAVKDYGIGAGASRLISGTSDLHRSLEDRIARFKNKEKALVFTTGYTANLGIITALVSEKDLIVIDKLDHASIIDACKLSGATLRVYPHKNTDKLENILRNADGFRRRLIVTDSVFSMDGDLAPLNDIVDIKNSNNAMLMIDEAHATGIFGKKGSGLAEHLGVEDDIEIIMGTLSKAVGVLGGYVAASRETIDYLINFSRPFIYSTALPPAACAACLEAIDIIESDRELRQRLWENVRFVKDKLAGSGYNVGKSESPIIPIMVGEEKKALELSGYLWEKGIFVPAIRTPTVSRGSARLRLTLSARHSQTEIEHLIEALLEWKTKN